MFRSSFAEPFLECPLYIRRHLLALASWDLATFKLFHQIFLMTNTLYIQTSTYLAFYRLTNHGGQVKGQNILFRVPADKMVTN